MASHAYPTRARAVLPLAALVRRGLWLAVGATMLVRLAAIVVLAQPPVSDGLAYFTMAQTLSQGGAIADNFGQHAFYSPGYPLLLAPFFRLLGAGSPTAYLVNVLLAGLSAALVWRLVVSLGGGRGAALLGGLGYAVWLPGIWLSTAIARENLSVPLLLGFSILCVEIARGRADWRRTVLAGAVFGAGLLAGTSIVLTGAAFVIALAFALHDQPGAGVKRLAGFALAALLVLAPWGLATQQLLGRPVLTTNGGFNLYIGNNPAANGRFVSMRDTPLGSVWHERLAVLGEAGAGDWLAGEARDWVAAHPGRAATLAAKKLVLFWIPNVPDRADIAASPLIAGLRVFDVVQYLAIVLLAGLALFHRGLDRRARWVLAAIVAGFWAVHGATYIIPRYRDPAMPLLIALAALTAQRWLDRRSTRA